MGKGFEFKCKNCDYSLSANLGIGFNYLVVPILNYVLTRIRAEKFIPFYYFNWEQMMVALITLLLGIIFYGYLRITLKKIQNQEKDGKPS